MRFPANERRVSPRISTNRGNWVNWGPPPPPRSTALDRGPLGVGSREHEVVVVEKLEEEGEEEDKEVVVAVEVEEGGARPRCFSSAKVRCRNALSPMWQ